MGIRTWIFCLFINVSTDSRHVTNSVIAVTQWLTYCLFHFFKWSKLTKESVDFRLTLFHMKSLNLEHSSPNPQISSYGLSLYLECGFPGSTSGKESACQCRRHKSSIPFPWVLSLGQGDPLEKEIAIHSSILAGRITWTEVPGGLQSMRLQRVGDDSTQQHIFGSHPKSGFMHPLVYSKIILYLPLV